MSSAKFDVGCGNTIIGGLFIILAGFPVGALADCPPGFPEDPVITEHLEQEPIAGGRYSFEQIREHGRELFVAQFNKCDGQGRPATTGAGEKRVPDEPAFNRISGIDANSCHGCHAQPRAGGGGDFVADVFVLANTQDPVLDTIDPALSNERNTLGMFGSGPIEMLAREMTEELQSQAASLPDGTHTLKAKGVEFEIVKENGEVVDSRGVRTDLVVRPFHQAGAVVSLRDFTVNAMNQHHGMQAEERFDLNPAKGFDPDFDEDGVERELTVGDITAVTLWQASLGVPQQVMPKDPWKRWSAKWGESLFEQIGCAGCHKPEMALENRDFVEPNPYNPSRTWSDETQAYSYDMTRQGQGPYLERTRNGGAVVKAYTDLKMHSLCGPEGEPDAIRHFCNEQLDQGRPGHDGKPGSEYFLTRKLWDVGNSAPYGHRGDLTTITEAILYHGGEGRAARDAFEALSEAEQRAVVDFLKTLQVVEPAPGHRKGRGKHFGGFFDNGNFFDHGNSHKSR
jgi:cytochrome c peroxidase